jgi:MazG family protein
MKLRILSLIEIIQTLRSKNGCPWNLDQDLLSMRPYLLEETFELLETLDLTLPTQIPTHQNDLLLCEELGDLLFVILLLAQIAEDQGRFSKNDCFSTVVNKMIVRHPHLFQKDIVGTNTDKKGSISNWEREKSKQKKKSSRLDGVPKNIPALLCAHRQGEKASSVGFDWKSVEGVLEKVEEEWQELQQAILTHDPLEIEHELGDLLMSLASLGRHLHIPPESALRKANNRFKSRFIQMEEIAMQKNFQLDELTDQQLDELWNTAKQQKKTQCAYSITWE